MDVELQILKHLAREAHPTAGRTHLVNKKA